MHKNGQMENYNMNFNEYLKEMMICYGFSQKKLASLIDVTEASMSKYLAGKRIPRIDVWIKLSYIFALSFDDLSNLTFILQK